MQVVSVKLAKHVVKNQDKLIAGITNVIEVEDDLKVCLQASGSQVGVHPTNIQQNTHQSQQKTANQGQPPVRPCGWAILPCRL